jgi:hypothetical protein
VRNVIGLTFGLVLPSMFIYNLAIEEMVSPQEIYTEVVDKYGSDCECAMLGMHRTDCFLSFRGVSYR